MSRYLHIFSSIEEVNAFKDILRDPTNEFVLANPSEYSAPENLLVFIASGPIVAPPKKSDYRKITESDFRFSLDDVFSQQFLDNDIERILLFAPHNHDGVIWLSQWWHVLDQDQTQTKPYQGLTNHYLTYIGGVSDINPPDGLNTSYLEATFRYSVLSTVIGGLFYKHLSKPLAGKILGSKKSALSLGMYRMLGAFATFDNPRCLQPTVANLDGKGNVIGSYVFDPVDAVPVPHHPRTKHAHVPDDFLTGHDQERDPSTTPSLLTMELRQTTVEDVKLSFPDHRILAPGDVPNNMQVVLAPRLHGNSRTRFLDHLDPYITCLLHDINIRYYNDLVHNGILSVARSPLLSNGDGSSNLREQIHNYFKSQIQDGILIGREASDFDLAWNIRLIEPSLDTMVLTSTNTNHSHSRTSTGKGSVDWITSSFEYSILYERYHANTFLRYCQLPVIDTFTVQARFNDLAGTRSANAITSGFPGVNTSKAEYFNWLGLLDESRVLKLPMDGLDGSGNGQASINVPATVEVVDSLLSLSHIFNVLESTFGQKPSYNYQLIRTLTRRGYLAKSLNGYRITGYGYAIYKAMESALGSGLDELDELDALQFRWNQYWLTDAPIFSVPVDSEFVSALDRVREIVRGVENSVAEWKRYRIVKKKTVTVKSSKTQKQPLTTKTTKRIYRLVVDRKRKAAWFECKGKIVPVHANVKQSTVERFGVAVEPVTIHISKLIPKPKSALRHSQVYEHPCPGCGHRVYEYVVVDDFATIKLQCIHCSTVSVDPAPFLILNNLPSSARKSDGSIRGESAVSLEGGGALGLHPNTIGAAQVAQHIRNQLGTGSVSQGILGDFGSKVRDLDSLLDDT